MKKLLFLLLLGLPFSRLAAQDYFPNNESVRNENNNFTAFTNAKIYVTPTQVIEQGTLLIREGKVINVGKSVALPKNCVVYNMEGKTIYPSFIDMYTNFGVANPAAYSGSREPLYDTKRKGFYWNEHIRSEVNASGFYKYDSAKAEEFLKAGFGVVNTHMADGVARGTGLIVPLSDESKTNKILFDKVTQHFAFTRSVTTNQAYPSSLMGMIALLKQMYHDKNWYKNGNSTYKDSSLEALIENEKLVQIFAAEDKLNALRVAKIGKEFGINYILKGSGNEFERIDDIKKTNAKFIVPVNFPDAYDVSDPYQANQMELADMRFWNQAPTNLKVLTENGVVFAITTDKLKKLEDFKSKLLKAIKYGFDKTKALEALTTVPASLLGKPAELGNLKNGAYANFIVTSGDFFDEKTILYENWVLGNKYVVNDMNSKDVRGNYELTFDNKTYQLKIEGELSSPKAEVKTSEDKKVNAKLSMANNWFNLLLKSDDSTKVEFHRLMALVTDTNQFSGKATMANGTESYWSAKKTSVTEKKAEETAKLEINKVFPVTFPNLPFGNLQKPKQETLLFKNVTVWTNEKEGILKETDVLIKNGKIAAIGTNLSDPSAKVIDGKGKHLTNGIIDEHSHIAISRGVNESGHNATAEVTIEDVVNSDDINIYRNLAGGVTTSQLLHGSANPIGGRSAIVKWKWGLSPDEMIYKNSPQFIKFALGENVKQANWGINNPTRFPQTRMGVEQVFMDYFNRAKEYDEAWKAFNAQGKKGKVKAPRVDLELQTLAEIINKKRFITCHSYVQSEILMLMRVAEKFGFRVNTYTHILEGYKVANEMKEHGVGASTFSDWWAYKYEVNDAIPYNGALLHNQGVTVAYNSDDAEMSRRLNQEAAKAVKYGNVSEEEAWKFVTLNPAKLLHIDDKVGSIKVGKDADLVLWNDNPLSVYAKAEKTMIEGVVYFDIETDEIQRANLAKEKSELIMQQLQEKNKGMITQEPKKKEKIEYHCDTLEH
ncbi:amidohydrolase family protein [Flavobacterium luminosum]|uniref:Amidohydrolase family protein n=1 Tax=Flavobacterium luminosum TaxID=2949086 RepID=A0ABT0TMQ7_9FLAO|nr:amidohydrolase family protein [Flavobacterium sp. HXWNR70]MCL9808773.1 amidohydrolase family protein [Flavobacterium sp. HXWNR70]